MKIDSIAGDGGYSCTACLQSIPQCAIHGRVRCRWDGGARACGAFAWIQANENVSASSDTHRSMRAHEAARKHIIHTRINMRTQYARTHAFMAKCCWKCELMQSLVFMFSLFVRYVRGTAHNDSVRVDIGNIQPVQSWWWASVPSTTFLFAFYNNTQQNYCCHCYKKPLMK